MRWLGYALGLVVGATFGLWMYDFLEQLTGIGGSGPPSFDFYVPLILFIVATGILIVAGRNRKDG